MQCLVAVVPAIIAAQLGAFRVFRIHGLWWLRAAPRILLLDAPRAELGTLGLTALRRTCRFVHFLGDTLTKQVDARPNWAVAPCARAVSTDMSKATTVEALPLSTEIFNSERLRVGIKCC